jgi:ferric-dicitrate binding protein FerR (iron transport regulator)
MSVKNTLARKTAKTAAKHTAHGTASKLKRNPMRTATLLGIGGALGALVGWMAGRTTATASVGTKWGESRSS